MAMTAGRFVSSGTCLRMSLVLYMAMTAVPNMNMVDIFVFQPGGYSSSKTTSCRRTL